MGEGRKRILLTGADGQLGWELRRCFEPLGEVAATVGPVTADPSVPGEVLDLADHAKVRRLLADLRPDVVLNAAAYTAVDRAEDETELASAINGVAPGVLAREAARHGSVLVHYSTDYVFDGETETGYRPSDRPSPTNVYGRTKLQGEEAIRAIGGSHLILRTSWLYGPRGNNFLLTLLRLIDDRRPLTVVDDQFGAPTWARSVAEITAQVFAQAQAMGDAWLAQRSGTYHVTAAGRCSWYEFARRILVAYSGSDRYEPGLVPVSSSGYPTKAKRPRSSVLDCSDLDRVFGLAIGDWTESLQRVMEELATRPRPAAPA